MRGPKRAVLMIAALAAAAHRYATGITLGLTAQATGTSTTYFGCLGKAGSLYKVGTVSPTCNKHGTIISWNSVGPPGPQGPAAQSTTGAIPQGNTGADVSLSLAAGQYAATWDINTWVFRS